MKIQGKDIYPNSIYEVTIILLLRPKIVTKILPELKIDHNPHEHKYKNS